LIKKSDHTCGWVSASGEKSRPWFFSVLRPGPILFSFFVGLCCVSDTKGQLTPALNVLFWNQVVEANQFISRALAPFISWLCGGRILFVLRCIHLGSLQISASVPSLRPLGQKQRRSLRLLLNERLLCSQLFLQSPKWPLPIKKNFSFIITPSRLRFRPIVLYFEACLGDSGRESSEKYRVIVPRVFDSDLLDHKRIEHAFASRVRVRDHYQCQHSDDCPRAGALVCQFLMAPDRA
jgi:hypothetical protein